MIELYNKSDVEEYRFEKKEFTKKLYILSSSCIINALSSLNSKNPSCLILLNTSSSL